MPEISCSRDCQFLTARLEKFELAKFMQASFESLLTPQTLENFAENQVGQSETLSIKLPIKVVGLAI